MKIINCPYKNDFVREDVKWVLMVEGEQAIAIVQKPEGHKRGLVTRIMKVCSNVDVRETFKYKSGPYLCANAASLQN